MLPRNQLQQALEAALRKKQNRAKRKVSRVARCILFVLNEQQPGLVYVRSKLIKLKTA